MQKPRMTLADVMKDMRDRGLPMTMKTISDCLKNGTLPFGHVINAGASGRTTFMIFRKEYEAWADEYLGDRPAN